MAKLLVKFGSKQIVRQEENISDCLDTLSEIYKNVGEPLEYEIVSGIIKLQGEYRDG